MKTTKLNIIFHNPNTIDETVKQLIKISSELAKTQINNILLSNELNFSSDNQEEQA